MNKNTFFLLLLPLFILFACKTQHEISPVEQAKYDLKKAVPELADVSDFYFEAYENQSSLSVVFKNSSVDNLVEFNKEDASIVLGYQLDKNLKDGSTTIQKALFVKKDSTISFEIRDLNNKLIDKTDSHIPGDIVVNPPLPCPVFNSFDDCLDDFYCTEFPALQCEANRRCETIVTGLCCCLPNGSCVWYDFIQVKPTDPSCIIIDRFKISAPVAKVQL